MMVRNALAFGSLEPGRVEPWRPAPFRIDPELVLRLARYRPRDSVPPAIREAAIEMAARADALATTQALVRPLRVVAAGVEGARLETGPAFSGRVVGRLLDGCPLAVVFVLTLGPALEAEVTALGDRRDLLEAYLLDTAGWAGIELAARALRLHVAARAPGRRPTPRLGPGHGDWPIEEQPALVALFDDAPPLVRLSAHGVLVPFKSISGVFGLRGGSIGP
jgi:hypothetical protein